MIKLNYLVSRIKSLDFKNMKKHINIVKEKSNKPKLFIAIDMIYCGIKYSAGYVDYSFFEFYKMNKKTRATYITRGINNDIIRKFNQKDYRKYFDSKMEFNKRFSEYIKKDWIATKDLTFDNFETFMKNRTTIMFKSDEDTCGHTVQKLSLADYSSLKEMYEYIISEPEYSLIEEYVVQHEDISKLYAGSVNTLRIATLSDKEGNIFIPYAFIRIGNGKSVDNLNNGGLIGYINIDQGIIEYNPVDKDGILYEEHPITHTKFIGHKIPYWNESIEYVKKAAKEVPEVRYIAWDVAVTEKRSTFN